MSEQTAAVAGSVDPGRVARVRREGPTNPFVRFERADVEQSIPARFEQIVRQYPERLAVKDGDEALTYRELNKAANRLAWAIIEQSLPESRPIAFLTEHGSSALVAMLGIQKAGRACVPLDSAVPPVTLSYELQHSDSGLIVVDASHLGLAQTMSAGAIPLLCIADTASGYPSHNPKDALMPGALALIVYTSGSTGQPKGVMHSHRTMLFIIRVHTNLMHISCNDRHALVTRYAHIAGICGIYRSLLNGAMLVPFDLSKRSVTDLPSWLAQQRITIYHSATSVFRRTSEAITGQQDLSNLRYIHLTSEPLRVTDIQLFDKQFPPGCLLCVMYGSTDGGVIATGWLDRRHDPQVDRVPVGFAPDEVDVLALDDAGSELPANTIGEIATLSSFLPLGYWRQPELTAASYLPDPRGGTNRLYRTGDLGLILDDGRVVLYGRNDALVKVRGLKVDTGVVEHALLSTDAFKEAAVVARPDAAGEQRLVAYLVARRQPAPTISAIRQRLAATLPSHMLPAAVVFLDALPLTSTGKVDRRALPDPGRQRPTLDVAYRSPRTPLEHELAAIWQKVLGVEPVGVEDSFFDLGGDSLKAAQVVARLGDRCGVALPPAGLFAAPTVAAMALVIVQAQAEQAGQEEMERLLDEIEGLPGDTSPPGAAAKD